MTIALTVVSFLLFTIGVFVDGKELVSVTEGDSVTLKSGVTKIQKYDAIKWTRSEHQMAKLWYITGSDSSDIPEIELDGPFKHRLQLDNQTGDLKISDISTTDSGEYKVKVSSPGGSPEMTFTVSVFVDSDAVKSVSVTEGDSVTLDSGLTGLQRQDVIKWRFGHLEIRIAAVDGEDGIFSTSGGDAVGFRDRLKLDHQTGSLTITNTRTKDSGVYKLQISRSRHTIVRSITVTVTGSGLSTGEIVGIVAGVLLVVAGLLVAARAGRVIPWCRRLHRYLQHRIRRNTTRSERVIFDKNGQNDKQQDTDNPANEGTKLNDL